MIPGRDNELMGKSSMLDVKFRVPFGVMVDTVCANSLAFRPDLTRCAFGQVEGLVDGLFDQVTDVFESGWIEHVVFSGSISF